MRKVILYMHVSLDGYIGGPNGELDWAVMTDTELDEYMGHYLLSTTDTMLLGRKLYQGFAQAWPAMGADPDSPPQIKEFARWIEDSPKIVFSRTLKDAGWKNARIAEGSIAETVAQLKKEPGGDMVVYGGAEFAAEIVGLGLVDEYRLKLEPVILGAGLSLFKDVKERQMLELIEAKAFSSGVTMLYYRPKR